MKIKIEIDEGIGEDEVVIRCAGLHGGIVDLQNYISRQNNGTQCLFLRIGETDYYIPVHDIYFFETEGREVRAHTADKLFVCPYKLYELEDLLPGCFMRISKSSIANLDYIYSITRNLTASSIVEFAGSKKHALVSRGYYKALAERLRERKLGRIEPFQADGSSENCKHIDSAIFGRSYSTESK